MRGGGEVGEAKARPGEPAAVVEKIIEIVEMLEAMRIASRSTRVSGLRG